MTAPEGKEIGKAYVVVRLDDQTQADYDAIRAAAEGQPDITIPTKLATPSTADVDKVRAQTAAEPVELPTKFAAPDQEPVTGAKAEVEAEPAATVRTELARPDQAPIEESRTETEAQPPVEVPTKYKAPRYDPRYDDPISNRPPVEVPTKAQDPINDAFRARLQASIRSLATDALKLPLDADTEGFRAKVDTALKEFSATAKEDVALIPDSEQFRATVMADVRTLEEEVKAKLRVEVDDASLAAAVTKIKAAEDEAGKSSGSSGGGGGGGAGFGALLGAGAAAFAGPIGGVALAAVPAAFAAIGIAAEHSNQQVTQAFSSMTAVAKQSLTQGFQPIVPALVTLASQARGTIGGLEPQFQAAANAVNPLLSAVGTGFLKATQEGVGASVPILRSLGPVADEVGADFVKVEQGVGNFLRNIDPSTAAQGLSVLGDVVKTLLGDVGSLINTISPLSNAVLPVLSSSVHNVVTVFGDLRPLFQLAGSAVTALSPELGVVVPVLATMAATAKLTTGSWTDFGGAATKLKSLITGLPDTLQNVGQKLGYTSDAAKESANAALTKAAADTKLQAAADAEAASELRQAANQSESARAALAASAAEDTATESAAAAAVAQQKLAAASEESSFAFGPLGIAIGVIGGLLLPLISNQGKATGTTQDLTQALVQLGTAGPSSVQSLISSTPGLADLVSKLSAAGISVQTYDKAIQGDSGAQQQFQSSIAASKSALEDQFKSLVGGNMTLAQFIDQTNRANKASQDNTGHALSLPPAVQKIVDAYNALNAVQGQYTTSLGETTATQQAASAVGTQAVQVVELSGEQQSAAANIAQQFGIGLDSVTVGFQGIVGAGGAAASSVASVSEQFLSNQVALGNAKQGTVDYFAQLRTNAQQADSAAADANHSYQQSIQAVTDAQHSYQQSAVAVITADQGVVTAQRAVTDATNSYANAQHAQAQAQQAVQDAEAGVVVAQNNVTKALTSAQQAQVNLTLAEKQAIETLKSLHLQLNDQVASEESARLKLFQQQVTSGALGVTAANAQAIAAETASTATQAQIQAALDLINAQNSLADTLNTGTNLRTQVTAADKAGVDGAAGVVSAQQSLASAQDQVVSSEQALVKAHQQVGDAEYSLGQASYNLGKAQQAITDAQTNVIKAEQGVQDALYNEQKAQIAVTDAVYNRQKSLYALGIAQTAAKKADDLNTSSLDWNTQAGRNNMTQLLNMITAVDNVIAPGTQRYNTLVQDTAAFFQGSTDKAAGYLKQLGQIPQDFKFGVTAVAAVDISQLQNQYGTSITSWIQNGQTVVRSGHAFADGGLFEGVGGPKDDANLVRLSNKEFVVEAGATERNLPLLEAINSGRIGGDGASAPGFANGGQVGGLLATNVAFGQLGTQYQDVVDSLHIMGLPAPAGLPAYVPPSSGLAPGASIAGYTPSGGVAQWEPQILQALAMLGQPPTWLSVVERRMQQESGGNPVVVNTTDSNWAAGHPSVGLMQVIGPTFRSYAGQFAGVGPYEYGTSVNPLANIYAGLNYAINRYGGLAALSQPGGYDNGGPLQPGLNLAWNGTGKPENVRTAAAEDALLAELRGLRADVAGQSAPGRSVSITQHITAAPNHSPEHIAALAGAGMQWTLQTTRE